MVNQNRDVTEEEQIRLEVYKLIPVDTGNFIFEEKVLENFHDDPPLYSTGMLHNCTSFSNFD